jgi:hypothetical protein
MFGNDLRSACDNYSYPHQYITQSQFGEHQNNYRLIMKTP